MLGSRLFLSSIALGLSSASVLPEVNYFPVEARATETAINAGNCNKPTDRACWRSPAPAEPTGFNVDTDSEKVWPTGVDQGANTITYSLSIAEKTMSPDGTPKLMQVVNGVYPGPVIEANWGDTVVVIVKNDLKDNGTSIHWHGLVQANTTTQDGVNGITECPIEPGGVRRYEWIATQHGTSWYHSHYSGQYGDGVLGPIKINGPATANYDEDLGTMTIGDFYEKNMYLTGLDAEINPGPPPAKGALINGMMKNAAGQGKYAEFSVEKGKSYRLRLINTAVDAGWKVSLDNHPFQVIAADFVPINNFNTPWLFLGIGQRYDVVFTANQTSDRYWFRVQSPGNDCANNQMSKGDVQKIFAIFGYKDKLSTADPTSKSTAKHDAKCKEEPGMTPRLAKPVPKTEFVFVDGPSDQLKVNNGKAIKDGHSITTWNINESEINVEWENPTIEYVANNTLSVLKAKPGNNIYELPQANKFYFWVIQNTGFGVPHPIHLHGHDFYILGQGEGKNFVKGDTSSLNFVNPLRRDVAMLPTKGYLVLAIYTDNPGVWLMHCHIGWHVAGGLGVQFVERESEIRSMKNNGLAKMQENCNSWDKWYNTTIFKKPDSGLRRPGSGVGK